MYHSEQGMVSVREIIEIILGDQEFPPGMKDTPRRVVESWKEQYGGYTFSEDDVANMLTQFDGENYNQMVIMRNVEFYSTCEHHLMPFSGVAHVAYIPDGNKVVGLSKLARVLDVYSRRFQMQERIALQVTQALQKHLKPKGTACMLMAKHHCVCSRGVGKQHSDMVTSELTGVFLEPAVRAEFFSLIGK